MYQPSASHGLRFRAHGPRNKMTTSAEQLFRQQLSDLKPFTSKLTIVFLNGHLADEGIGGGARMAFIEPMAASQAERGRPRDTHLH
jgi:hypothetical protein